MRIVSGKHKGRFFSSPTSFSARPTTDIAKEGLFNILNNRVDFEEISVLDLFAGTGSISFEFASRGCTNITLVEINQQHLQFIYKVIGDLHLDSIKPLRYDAFKFVEKCTKRFDIIFADPPYTLKDIEKIPELILSKNLLNPNGLLIVEHPKSIDFSDSPFFKFIRKYGSVCFSFFGEQI